MSKPHETEEGSRTPPDQEITTRRSSGTTPKRRRYAQARNARLPSELIQFADDPDHEPRLKEMV